MSDAHEKENDAVSEEAKSEPFLKVVRGLPDDAEVAALVAVLSKAAASGGGAAVRADRNLWGQPTDLHRPAWGQPTSYIHG